MWSLNYFLPFNGRLVRNRALITWSTFLFGSRALSPAKPTTSEERASLFIDERLAKLPQ